MGQAEDIHYEVSAEYAGATPVLVAATGGAVNALVKDLHSDRPEVVMSVGTPAFFRGVADSEKVDALNRMAEHLAGQSTKRQDDTAIQMTANR